MSFVSQNDKPEAPEQSCVLAETVSVSSRTVWPFLLALLASVHNTFLVSGHVIGTKQEVRGVDLQQEEPKSRWTSLRTGKKTPSAFLMDTEFNVQRLVDAVM